MQLSAECQVERPAEAVFTFISDSSNNPQWQRGQRSCVWTSSPPIRVGSTYDQEARFLGRTVINRFRVTELVPSRSITIQSTEGSFPITVRRSVEPLDENRSRVTAEIRGEPGGFFRLVLPLVRSLAQRSVQADYRRLKQLLEA